MLDDWSPTTLAKLSLMIMFIPAGLTVIVVIVSILIDIISEFTGIKKNSAVGIKLNKVDRNILYIAFLSVVIINVTAVGLFTSGVWAVLNYFFALIN